MGENPSALDYGEYQPYLFKYAPWYGIIPRPSVLFPDSFEVKYVNGESETFYTAIVLQNDVDLAELGETTSDGMFQLPVEKLEEHLNRAGDAYRNYTQAIALASGKANDGTLQLPVPEKVEEQLDRPGVANRNYTEATALASGEASIASRDADTAPTSSGSTRKLAEEYIFDEMEPLPHAIGDEDSHWGYKINEEDGYAVLKIQGFDCNEKNAVEFWQRMALAAKSKGIKKLIVDVSW